MVEPVKPEGTVGKSFAGTRRWLAHLAHLR